MRSPPEEQAEAAQQQTEAAATLRASWISTEAARLAVKLRELKIDLDKLG